MNLLWFWDRCLYMSKHLKIMKNQVFYRFDTVIYQILDINFCLTQVSDWNLCRMLDINLSWIQLVIWLFGLKIDGCCWGSHLIDHIKFVVCCRRKELLILLNVYLLYVLCISFSSILWTEYVFLLAIYLLSVSLPK